MNIFKLLPAVGVIAFCASFIPVHAQDNAAQTAARAALEKMNQMPAPEPPAPPPAPSAAAVLAAPVEPAAPAASAAESVAPAASTNLNAETQQETRAALMSKMNAQNPSPNPGSGVAPAAGPVPIVAPPLPISATTEQKLQALLELYKADQITPEEYQKKRAAILAGH